MGINNEAKKEHLCYPFKSQAINYWSFVNSYITSKRLCKDIWGSFTQLCLITILSALQLFLFYYERTNRNSKLLTSPIIWLPPVTALGAGERRSRGPALAAHAGELNSLRCNVSVSLGHSVRRMNMDDMI